ncbi:Unannotated [Lentimonas sp. CC4]|nr:Unannotated [Lentimonas sp. CC4]CAA6685746.1 Unannotated [Lentimonas sp. CC6]CAA7076220.1 Unannotated [Lentimonas sp. CC4]CAA7168728.1 Unannotated [Lentimonas sp. CC21]CAA7183466.1 Unannotated [Lentimonas sp. CC8]
MRIGMKREFLFKIGRFTFDVHADQTPKYLNSSKSFEKQINTKQRERSGTSGLLAPSRAAL